MASEEMRRTMYACEIVICQPLPQNIFLFQPILYNLFSTLLQSSTRISLLCMNMEGFTAIMSFQFNNTMSYTLCFRTETFRDNKLIHISCYTIFQRYVQKSNITEEKCSNADLECINKWS